MVGMEVASKSYCDHFLSYADTEVQLIISLIHSLNIRPDLIKGLITKDINLLPLNR